MSEVKHSAGPWEASFSEFGEEIYFGGYGKGTWYVGPAYIGGDGGTEEGRARMKADACLIAAAPELLEALKDAVAFAKSANLFIAGQDPEPAVKWDAAIAKAEGRS